MILKRRALLAALIAGGSAVPAGAGCFDWLFGKHHSAPVMPYAVGFAPVTTVTPLGPPVAIGAPVITQGAIVQNPLFQSPGAQFSDVTPIARPTLAPGGYMSNFGGYPPATAAQMPAYAVMPQAINNPSVLTGRPVQIGTVGGATTAFYGGAALPQASYNAAAAYQSQPFQSPATTHGGVLGHVLGNNYQTQYNNVPTTVYRPVQQIDPATGQVVIVQQPCVTTTQQVQRTPYTSLQPAQPTTAAPYYGEPGCGNEPPQYLPQGSAAPQPYPSQQYQGPSQTQPAPQASYPLQGNSYPQGYAPTGSGISQATAIAPSYNGGQTYASPIPSSGAPAMTPLQGYPGSSYDAGAAAGDAGPMQQPRLESTRPSQSPPQTSWPAPPEPSPWTNGSGATHNGASGTAASNNGATYRSPQPAAELGDASDSRQATIQPPSTASNRASSEYSDLPPIPAADDYRPPAWQSQQGGDPQPAAESDPRPRWQQPRISPPSLDDRTAMGQQLGSLDRREQPARYASTPQEPPRPAAGSITKPATQARDDGGWFAIP